ncbi:hypothetical protein SmJEL517_g06124 [Synchytrium microbalum]|uniref:Uncharacterized protein n=1 Tax=Synchytrium microbalum TaxID=1806994 RepID=A0A507BYD5_9FUNG|nr:uncharacterized protein SmJEL517_g06124 [Synchytrium microbalum]TPX30283.1 hypothetical protein SmJEL517_g06124 [Synchytrium microbalum]
MVLFVEMIFLPLLWVAHTGGQCILTIPDDPLTAVGLATPYVLSGCSMVPDTSTFAQAAVITPSFEILAYNPLVIQSGTVPLETPVIPEIPCGSVVAIWFGSNAANVTLVDRHQGQTLHLAQCVQGFGQFAYCHAAPFFERAFYGGLWGHLQVPDLGVGLDSRPCPTTRDFRLVDQDQSDNLPTTYLLEGNQTAQDTTANRAKHPNATILNNGSDNLLLDAFVAPALNCSTWKVTDLADPCGPKINALPLNEIMAAVRQTDPVALVPSGDPMVSAGGLPKLNLYRVGVFQPLTLLASTGDYCGHLVNTGLTGLVTAQSYLTAFVNNPGGPAVPNLYEFLLVRWQQSYENLGCAGYLNLTNPVTIAPGGNISVALPLQQTRVY